MWLGLGRKCDVYLLRHEMVSDCRQINLQVCEGGSNTRSRRVASAIVDQSLVPLNVVRDFVAEREERINCYNENYTS